MDPVTIAHESLPTLVVILVLLVQARTWDWRFEEAAKDIERLKSDVQELKKQRAAVLRLEI